MNTEKTGKSNQLAEFAAVAIRWFKLDREYDSKLCSQVMTPLILKACEINDWRPSA